MPLVVLPVKLTVTVVEAPPAIVVGWAGELTEHAVAAAGAIVAQLCEKVNAAVAPVLVTVKVWVAAAPGATTFGWVPVAATVAVAGDDTWTLTDPCPMTVLLNEAETPTVPVPVGAEL